MVFDGHADILTNIYECKKKNINNVFKNRHIKQFEKGNIKAGIFVIWIDPYSEKNKKEELISTLASVSNEILENSDILKVVKNGKDLKVDDNEKRIQMIMGIEGLKCIENDTDLIDMLYLYGIRHMSLTWNEENRLGTGVYGCDSRGLTQNGIEVIKKLEHLNMIIDVSHLNEKTFWDVLDNTEEIIIASHSNARSICDHNRNLNDDQLKSIANRGGVVGVNVHGYFVHKNKKHQNIENLIAHIDHMKKTIGIDHIGFGFDFCEYLEEFENPNIYDVENASYVGKIIEYLRKSNYSQYEIEKISYKNFERVVKEVLK